jgi:hypothetical protein
MLLLALQIIKMYTYLSLMDARKSPTPTSRPDVSGSLSTYKGAPMDGLSQFFRWRSVVDKNGTRTDEAHTSFMTPIRRPYVLARLEMEGCFRCLRDEGGFSYWVPFLDGEALRHTEFCLASNCFYFDLVILHLQML